jgi:Ca2+-binding RTX toxin-like protein
MPETTSHLPPQDYVLTAIDCDDRIIGAAGDNTIAGGGGNDTIDLAVWVKQL